MSSNTKESYSNRLCKERDALTAEEILTTFFETYSTWDWERYPVALRRKDLEGQGCESFR